VAGLLPARPWTSPTAIVLAAVPVRLALALSTDLSPDEAYYLCAARRPEVVPPMDDHPPLLPWLLRASDGLGGALPVELRVRVWPLLLSVALGLLVVELARRRGAGPTGLAAAAWLGSWSLLPMAGGFVATPDGPALVACGALLLWALGPLTRPGELAGARGDSMAGAAAREDRDRGALLGSAAWSVGALIAGSVGALAKVVVAPVALAAAFGAARSRGVRLAVALSPALIAPWLVPSLRFQLAHAAGTPTAWRAVDAAGAAATAVVAQAALWSPWVLASGLGALAARDTGARPMSPWPVGRTVVALFSVLVAVSAVARALPPEPNWWAPAALVVIVAAAQRSEELAPRWRATMLATAVVPTLVVTAHVVSPWLPLPSSVDPSARLHGWSTGAEPSDAPGIGPYGSAAERCVYASMCDDINAHFDKMTSHL
jgi:hypothetical protein